MVGMGDGDAAVERIDLARDEDPGAGRCLGFAVEFEEDQFGRAGFVLHHDPPGLAGVGGSFVADDFDRQGRDGAGAGGGDFRAVTAIQVGFWHVKQEIDHPIPAHGARDRRRQRGADAAEGRDGGEERGERGGRFHGVLGLVGGSGFPVG